MFGADFVELRPLSGHVAGAAVLLGLLRPGDLALELDREAGGHRLATKLLEASQLMSFEVQYLPFDSRHYNIDTNAASELIMRTKPRLVLLGSSTFLFPHPVREIATIVRQLPDSVLVYDASHVMGFLAAKRFQDPLAEGADIVFGSTHKTLPGPQGGIILSNREDLMAPVVNALYPGLVTNHHPFRIPALGLALLELREWGADYADQIVANARALGVALQARGIPVLVVDGKTTASHTLIALVAQFGTSNEVAERMERSGIIAGGTILPEDLGCHGIRIGVQEITRRGATESLMARVASLIADSVKEARPYELISQDVRQLAQDLGTVRFGLE
jgi:glycine hydroxymethyltransferase